MVFTIQTVPGDCSQETNGPRGRMFCASIAAPTHVTKNTVKIGPILRGDVAMHVIRRQPADLQESASAARSLWLAENAEQYDADQSLLRVHCDSFPSRLTDVLGNVSLTPDRCLTRMCVVLDCNFKDEIFGVGHWRRSRQPRYALLPLGPQFQPMRRPLR